MKILRDLYAKASKDVRVDVPLSELRVGLKCGGSDGFSGITANPLLGMFSDFLIAQGGTSVLTEVPEMFGAETILMNRCENKDLFNQTVHLINDFKEYFLSHGEPVGENLHRETRPEVSLHWKRKRWAAHRNAERATFREFCLMENV
ncbi:altronate hydrolase [Bacteroides graminisolvens DSM 19988 = JCM 15093]|uniref:Altronate hydrolase n=1 Tax=Bacteroides graminisolvens DSM 19988 = JCM 15093 TaxID=1121097 RepID=A0A069D5T0_9BACE|nr:altronate hydrolase [Bacteroides graminisolvens DSM 19988 = JCM 15093]